jgi:hypothetical protein
MRVREKPRAIQTSRIFEQRGVWHHEESGENGGGGGMQPGIWALADRLKRDITVGLLYVY